ADHRDVSTGSDRQAVAGLDPAVALHPATARRIDHRPGIDPNAAIGGQADVAAVIERRRGGAAAEEIVDPQAARIDHSAGVQFDVAGPDRRSVLRSVDGDRAGPRHQLAVDRNSPADQGDRRIQRDRAAGGNLKRGAAHDADRRRYGFADRIGHAAPRIDGVGAIVRLVEQISRQIK
ncbi:hypothetical protein SA9_12400, partial [Staphylococcus warneri]